MDSSDRLTACLRCHIVTRAVNHASGHEEMLRQARHGRCDWWAGVLLHCVHHGSSGYCLELNVDEARPRQLSSRGLAKMAP